jgi:hypothetical protein
MGQDTRLECSIVVCQALLVPVSEPWPMAFYIIHGHGGFARLCRRLPMRGFWGALSRECRMGFLVQRKQAA